MREDEFRLEFSDDGHLRLAGRDGWQIAICPFCGEPIQWCLDMFSFTTGDTHELAHARCVWMPEAFQAQAKQSRRASKADA